MTYVITKMQADFIQEKKKSLGPREFFVVQDEIQSFHWNNNSATIHLFVCDSRDNGVEECLLYCHILMYTAW